uniref:Peptidase M11 gametolysin domain-containing protein n=1 Tax=Corethron hystrix TaxID=216773 RepID=A0A7S1B9T3_9STRA|mmetsp:Transcript_18619/g.42561  ORF Transcript_18619/g.42561 Transcript_18619/m.42561 type:complete len:339 (+) Transcript_18619:230-1246(+)
MNLLYLALVPLVCSLDRAYIDANVTNHSKLIDNHNETFYTTSKILSKPCTILAVEFLIDPKLSNNDTEIDTAFVCEIHPKDNDGKSGKRIPIKVQSGQMKELTQMLNNGTLISGETRYDSTGNYIYGNELHVFDIDPEKFKVKKRKSKRLDTGIKPILAIRVTATDYDVEDSADQISDDIFGTYGDPNNLVSQFSACTFGQLNITTDYDDPNIDAVLAAPGVLNVNINMALEGSGDSYPLYAIEAAVQRVAERKLGFELPGPFEQVMIILHSCRGSQCGYAAYAYIHDWLSVFVESYYKYTGVLVHELGHNFGLAHSGRAGSGEYTDHSCMVSSCKKI